MEGLAASNTKDNASNENSNTEEKVSIKILPGKCRKKDQSWAGMAKTCAKNDDCESHPKNPCTGKCICDYEGVNECKCADPNSITDAATNENASNNAETAENSSSTDTALMATCAKKVYANIKQCCPCEASTQ